MSNTDCMWTAEWLWPWLCHRLIKEFVKTAFLFKLLLSPESQWCPIGKSLGMPMSRMRICYLPKAAAFHTGEREGVGRTKHQAKLALSNLGRDLVCRFRLCSWNLKSRFWRSFSVFGSISSGYHGHLPSVEVLGWNWKCVSNHAISCQSKVLGRRTLLWSWYWCPHSPNEALKPQTIKGTCLPHDHSHMWVYPAEVIWIAGVGKAVPALLLLSWN